MGELTDRARKMAKCLPFADEKAGLRETQACMFEMADALDAADRTIQALSRSGSDREQWIRDQLAARDATIERLEAELAKVRER